jgi:hypothetical protein
MRAACWRLLSSSRSAVRRGDSLSVEQLTQRFERTLPEHREAILCTRLTDLSLARTRIATSRIAGNGLFADRQIAAGELVTMYPCDVLLSRRDPAEQLHRVRLGLHAAEVGLLGRVSLKLSDCPSEARRYMVRLSQTQAVIANPHAIEDAAYLGHMANDGAECTGAGTALERYLRASQTAANAGLHIGSMHGCHVALVASKPIEAGTEILVSYGPSFWLAKLAVPPRRYVYPDGGEYFGDVSVNGVIHGAPGQASYSPRTRHAICAHSSHKPKSSHSSRTRHGICALSSHS